MRTMPTSPQVLSDAGPATPPVRIVIADDDIILCTVLQEILVSAGYEVLVAYNGDQLVRMAQENSPDLVLVDLMMPLMDGFEAIRQLRNDTRTAHLPMLILTARGSSQEVVTGFDTGADDYIVKPYDIDVLLARIRGHLRRAAQRPVRNPLTGLPGNVLLQAELARLIAHGEQFSLVYIDLDNFKVFNDVYGFARGDRAIHLLARVLAEVAPAADFIGHIGGDDFAVIHLGDDVESFCQSILDAFDAQVGQLYDPEDRERGFLVGFDRQGVQRRFGMLSVSVAAVTSRSRRFSSVEELGRVAAEVKAAAKLTSGSSYQIDRREQRRQPLHERRGQRRPTALLVHWDRELRASIATALRIQGYRPLIAANPIAAQALLARTPRPHVAVVGVDARHALAETTALVPPETPLIAVAPDEATAGAALAAGATAAVMMGRDLIEFTDQLLASLPLIEHEQALGESQDHLIRQLRARADVLERAAFEDALTGLTNRRGFDRGLARELVRAEREGQPVCLALADIDNFKQVNDRFSHQVGDEVLRRVAAILRAHGRPGDVVARYGGEEFVLLLPGLELPAALAVVEQARAEVAGFNWGGLMPGLKVTISCGLARHSGGGPEALLAEADTRLYAAKLAGKNRTEAG